MTKIYLKVFTTDNLCHVPIETFVTLFTIKYCNSDVPIYLVKSKRAPEENLFIIDISTFQYEFIEHSEISKIANKCELPNLEDSKNSCIAGLCATLRKIIKNVILDNPEHYAKELLGFKESCLLSCSETSVWTKFCEVDIVSMLKTINIQNQGSILPTTLARFEHHMSQPVKLHNLYKYTMSKKIIGKSLNKDRNVLPEHIFAEEEKKIYHIIPMTIKWYKNILNNEHVVRSLNILSINNENSKNITLEYSLPIIQNQSLYKSDPKRYKPRNRIYTRQEDIDYSLEKIKSFDLKLHLDEVFGQEKIFNWSNIPVDATPEGGNLPNKRLNRKFQQLESLCKPILKLAKEGDTIVDFCSGGGHLGILLAYLLPLCNIILLENKAESLKKAKTRVHRLSLNNVRFYQSNLDYFIGNFDIGTCLHACGVATDLVLQQCIEKNAAFVCCPCCYGSVQDCHRVIYPRSQVLKQILDKRSYLVLGHAADQTHNADNVKTKQGYECMMIIDSDRRMQAQEHGYQVCLNKLTPETCSPKNHLLIGWPNKLRKYE